jgi:hypothetical protein
MHASEASHAKLMNPTLHHLHRIVCAHLAFSWMVYACTSPCHPTRREVITSQRYIQQSLAEGERVIAQSRMCCILIIPSTSSSHLQHPSIYACLPVACIISSAPTAASPCCRGCKPFQHQHKQCCVVYIVRPEHSREYLQGLGATNVGTLLLLAVKTNILLLNTTLVTHHSTSVTNSAWASSHCL